MFSTLETIAIIAIIIVQLVITNHAYRQIKQMRSFLPDGKSSLTLKEYEIPVDKILQLEPSQVVDKITFQSANIQDAENYSVNDAKPRDEKGRFVSKRTVYSPIHGDIGEEENDELKSFI
ncbi:MAG: hypothetical protein IKI83_01440 [Prevotella sp.]|nr:hypothetical protein [Prevotella sp.]